MSSDLPNYSYKGITLNRMPNGTLYYHLNFDYNWLSDVDRKYNKNPEIQISKGSLEKLIKDSSLLLDLMESK